MATQPGEAEHRAKYQPGSRRAEAGMATQPGEAEHRAKYQPGSKQAEYEQAFDTGRDGGGSREVRIEEKRETKKRTENSRKDKAKDRAKNSPKDKAKDKSKDKAEDKKRSSVKKTLEASAPGSLDFQKKISARRHAKHRKLLLIIASVLFLCYTGAAVYFGFHFYSGTVFYGLDCSYKTAEEVKQEAVEKLDKYVLEIRERDDRTETVSAQQIGLTFEGGDSVDRMMKAQRSYIWPVMPLLGRTQNESIAFSYDADKAQETINGLICMDSVRSVAPRDAYVGITDSGYEVVQEVMGTTVDQERTRQAVLQALDAGELTLSLEEEACYVNPKLYSDDEGLNSDAAAMSELARAHITYDFGDRQEVIDTSVIDGWIVRLDDGSFTIDDARVTQYVQELAAKYDTFGLTRQFYTSIGTVETLTGGDYGWCMDQDATMAALMKALDEGYQGTMEPEYLYTAMSRDTNDIGYTYVEVCISQQRMWCYQDGNLIVDTPVVTGNPNKDNGTPSGGVWAIDAKMRDYVLKGEGYTAPVDYWMPFNGDVGIHDMQARAQFGGTIYLSNGSHGCVNTPYEQAQTIYNTVSIGTPVIVYE